MNFIRKVLGRMQPLLLCTCNMDPSKRHCFTVVLSRFEQWVHVPFDNALHTGTESHHTVLEATRENGTGLLVATLEPI
eukprot:1185713-Prorocentrum_minimum.AAC.1